MMLPQVVEQIMNKLSISLSRNNIKLESIYIYGSIALGDFIEGTSDIDFIAIVSEPPTISDLQAISAAHKEVENEFPQTDIMGAYLLQSDIGKPHGEMSCLLTYYNKQVHTNGLGADINPITWWTLKYYGIKVYGSTQPFNYEIEITSLLSYVIENLNTYWVKWIERLEEQLPFIHLSDAETAAKHVDEAVEWCTLGMLRQLYTLKEHDIKSKVQAGYYGIKIMPQQWHELIYEAIHIKRLLPERFYHSNEHRLTDLIALLRYIHLEANRVYEEWALKA